MDLESYMAGFMRAVEMVRDEEDRYGIGSMLSQWTGRDIAEDMVQRVEEEIRHAGKENVGS